MRTYAAGNPLVFNHIPKCAGTSLRTALVQVLHPEQLLYGVDLALVGGYDHFESMNPAVRRSFFFSPDELAADATFVTGHITPGTTEERYPDADHITMLRNPRLRVMSQWIHSRSLSDFDLRHFGKGAAAFRIARRPLREYLQHEMIAPNVDNTITRFLTWPHPLLERTAFIEERHDDEILAAALERLDRFSHVGVIENPTFLTELGAWLGTELPDTRLNERSSMPRRRRPDLTAELSSSTVDLLDHRTRLDRQLWTHVAAKTLRSDPDEAFQSSWEKSIERYASALQEPGSRRPVRQVAVALYGTKRLVSRDR